MNGQLMMYVDQYGDKLWARTVKELREKCGGGRVFKIYCDMKPDGKSGVGPRWFHAFQDCKKLVRQDLRGDD